MARLELMSLNSDNDVTATGVVKTTQSPKGEMSTKTEKGVPVTQFAKFPSDVHNHKNYLIFRAFTPQAQTVSSLREQHLNFINDPEKIGTPLCCVSLYMPALIENIQHTYAKDESSLLAEFAGIGIEALGSGSEAFGDSSNSAIQVGVASALKSVANKAKFNAASSLINAASQATGIVADRSSFLYKGSQPRTQSFHFTLRSSNFAELKEIGKLVHYFQLCSAATRGNLQDLLAEAFDVDGYTPSETSNHAFTMRVPPVWFIEERINNDPMHSTRLGRSTNRFMMGGAGLTSIKINKTPDQIYQSIMQTSGDPLSIELELTFQEMIPVYSETYAGIRANSYIAPVS